MYKWSTGPNRLIAHVCLFCAVPHTLHQKRASHHTDHQPWTKRLLTQTKCAISAISTISVSLYGWISTQTPALMPRKMRRAFTRTPAERCVNTCVYIRTLSNAIFTGLTYFALHLDHTLLVFQRRPLVMPWHVCGVFPRESAPTHTSKRPADQSIVCAAWRRLTDANRSTASQARTDLLEPFSRLWAGPGAFNNNDVRRPRL